MDSNMTLWNNFTSCVDFKPLIKEFLYCYSHVDDLGTCWNYTKAGETASAMCPRLPGFNINAFVKKKCENNGSWYFDTAKKVFWSDYSSCIHNIPHAKIVYVFFAGYSLSVVCLIISLFIFFFFKQLKCDRVTLHKNLFACHLINAIIWIIFYSVISYGEVMMDNPVYCQMLFVIATYFSLGTYFWMFSEGLYLAVVLILTFHRGSVILFICIATGWGLPLILTLAYAITRYLQERPEQCWIRQSSTYLILAIPNFIALGANFIILLFILRMLITKLRHPRNREETQWSKTAKAIFILIPLLGLQNILFFIYPDNPQASLVQDYITAFLTSFQGVLVSTILCFCNSEVRTIVRRRASHSVLQPLKSSRRGTYTTELASQPQPKRSLVMRAFSIQSAIISI